MIDWKDIGDGVSAARLLDTMRSSKLLIPSLASSPQGQRILIIAPHPDDEVIGMGGTLIQMINNGCNVKVVYFTLGNDKCLREESYALSQILGFSTNYMDFNKQNIGLDQPDLEQFAEIMESYKPDCIFLPFMLDDHDDHRRVNEFLVRAFQTKLEKSSASIETWAYQVYTPLPLNTVVNITNVIDQKCDAIRYYKSQFTSRDWAHFAKSLNGFNVRFLSGEKGASYAEVFYRTNLKNYVGICSSYFGSNPENCYENPNYKNPR